MTESLWGNISDIEHENKAEDILEHQFDILANMTEGRVRGEVRKFDIPFEKGYTISVGNPISNIFQDSNKKIIPSIQSFLREYKKKDAITLEAYLKSKNINDYKYRFMVLSHGITPYPVEIYIESTIASDIHSDVSEITCANENEFTIVLEKILKSNRVMDIVSKLAAYK